jgi:hypothetical protein
MPRSRTGNLIAIPILNDLVFTLLYNATPKQQRSLGEKYMKIMQSAAKVRNFVTVCSREEKEYILTHFGFRFFYVVLPEDLDKLTELNEELESFEGGYGIKSTMYVHGDQQFAYLLNLYAKAIHHQSHFLNYELLRAGYHLKKWKKENSNPEQMEIRDAMETESHVLRTIFSTMIMTFLFQGSSGLSLPHIHILTYLAIKRHSYVEKERIYELFKGFGAYDRPNYARAALRELTTEKLVQKNPADTAYSITSLGLKKIAEFRDSILNYSNFY